MLFSELFWFNQPQIDIDIYISYAIDWFNNCISYFIKCVALSLQYIIIRQTLNNKGNVDQEIITDQ